MDFLKHSKSNLLNPERRTGTGPVLKVQALRGRVRGRECRLALCDETGNVFTSAVGCLRSSHFPFYPSRSKHRIVKTLCPSKCFPRSPHSGYKGQHIVSTQMTAVAIIFVLLFLLLLLPPPGMFREYLFHRFVLVPKLC